MRDGFGSGPLARLATLSPVETLKAPAGGRQALPGVPPGGTNPETCASTRIDTG
ncbi:hypothetical protein ACFSZS_26010 [Seohaeicola zhoushanensis]